MNKEIIFSEGIYFKKKHPNAPEFVKGSVSIKVKDLIPFLNQHVNEAGYVNLTLKKSKADKYYFQLDTWTKTLDESKKSAEKAGTETKKVVEDVSADEIPF